jgi:hypothetical protein
MYDTAKYPAHFPVMQDTIFPKMGTIKTIIDEIA